MATASEVACPRCSQRVRVLEGWDPVCQRCGYTPSKRTEPATIVPGASPDMLQVSETKFTCGNCGTISGIPKGTKKSCVRCGSTVLQPVMELKPERVAEFRAAAAPPPTYPGIYWALPLLLGVIGGLIGFALVNDRDRQAGVNMIVVGLAASVVSALLVSWALLFLI